MTRSSHPEPTRRLAAKALALSALAGCSRSIPRKRQTNVSILRAPGYTQALYEELRRVLAEHKLDMRGKKILLKPNLVEFDPGTAINTHPLLVHAAVEAFRSFGAAEVRIGEGPGHRNITLDLADAAGYFTTVPGFEDIFVDLNVDEVRRVGLRRPFSRLKSVYLPAAAQDCDLLVSMPKMKTHHWVGATLSMKNLFGLVPGAIYGWPKNVLHWAGIDECIADLATVPRDHFAIVDGIEGMEGNGPIQGKPKHCGVVVCGRDLPAVDSTCCRIMGIDPGRIRYLELVAGRDGTRDPRVTQIGEPVEKVRTEFELIPQFRHIRLPGLG